MNNKNSYRDDFQTIIFGKGFCICVLLVVLLAFGFATFNMAVSRDDLQGYIYTGSGQNMLASGRFTIFLIDRLTSTTIHGPVSAYTNDILAILGLVWAAINFCIFFRRVCGKSLSNAACTVFTCFFVTYPLIAELWEYIGAYRVVAFGYLCDSFALLMMYDVLHQKMAGNWKKVLASCILLMLVCAGYESLVPVYIFCVFSILAIQVVCGSQKEKKLAEILRQGLCYAGVLAAGLVLRIVVHRVILLVLQLPPSVNGDAEFSWGTSSFGAILALTLRDIVQDYVLRAAVYFPIAELVISAVILLILGIVLARRSCPTILLPGLGMYISLIILNLIQGKVTGYRICQVFAIFVAFTAMIMVMIVEKSDKRWLRITALLLCGYLCFQQADQTNYFLTLNYMRSEEEMAVVRQIGTELYENYDVEKPVIFVGGYTLSEAIIEAASVPEDSKTWDVYLNVNAAVNALLEYTGRSLEIPDRKLSQSNINSIIDFGMWSFDGNQEAMRRLFAYAGFDYVLPDCNALQPEADAYVEMHNIPAYPRKGYIQDVGEYIIVHIQ